MLLGSLMLGLRSLGLGSCRPDTSDILSSISELAHGLLGISIYGYESCGHHYRHYNEVTHDACNIQGELRARIKKVLENVPSGMTEDHQRHIRIQYALLHPQ